MLRNLKFIYKSVFTIMTSIILLSVLLPEAKADADDWFTTYDHTDVEKVWEMITRPVTVYELNEKREVYLLDKPGGRPIKSDKLGGYIWSDNCAVRVLGEDEDGYTLVEAYDDYDRLLQGYVKTKYLKEKEPNKEIGIVIDKLTQRIYVYKNAELLTEIKISTGLSNSEQPYNETASGEFLITSWVGDFSSGNMLCRKGIRFNGGDLIHVVPCLINADGTYNYSPFEPLLGEMASHGCVRVEVEENADGYNMDWLWDNLKKDSKVLVWDNDGREQPYPDDYKLLYYNPSGGQNYHSTANCSHIKDRYLPLTPFYYGQLRYEPFSSLTPCPYCNPVKSETEIDSLNEQFLEPEDYADLMERRQIVHESFDPLDPPDYVNSENVDTTIIAPPGTEQKYPDDYSYVYYNPEGGQNYHGTAYCPNVRERFLPLTQIFYGELRSAPYNKLTPCPHCATPMEEDEIDKINKENLSQAEYEKLMEKRSLIHEKFDPLNPPVEGEEIETDVVENDEVASEEVQPDEFELEEEEIVRETQVYTQLEDSEKDVSIGLP